MCNVILQNMLCCNECNIEYVMELKLITYSAQTFQKYFSIFVKDMKKEREPGRPLNRNQ